MTRALSALLLALGLLLTSACSENLSGDSNPDNQVEQEPAGEDGSGSGEDDDEDTEGD
jgi:hypothetical protein